MDDRLSLLIELQELDSAIQARKNEKDRHPDIMKTLEQRRTAAREDLDKVREALQTAQKNKRDRDRDLETGAQKVEKLKARTSEIKTNKEYQALLKEIEAVELENKAIEDDILVLMEKIDASAAQIATAEKRAAEEEATIQAEQKQLEAVQAKLEEELRAQEEERRKIAERVDASLLIQYQKLFEYMGGKAVVEAWDESCSGCRMKIPPQTFVNIKKKEEIITCPHCHRILYYKEAIVQKGT